LITREIFQTDPVTCARSLLGIKLVHGRCAGMIVETEAYTEFGDAASHFHARPSTRRFFAEHPEGTAYVYLNYGFHWLFNVLVRGRENGAVLVRALEPMEGISTMRRRRKREREEDLCSGPGKLSQALGIGKKHHGVDLCATKSPIRLLPGPEDLPIETDTRIGISSAQDLPWRFFVRDNRHVSRGKQTNRPG